MPSISTSSMFSPSCPPPIMPPIPPIIPPPIPDRRWPRASISSMKTTQPPHVFARLRAARTMRKTLNASMPRNMPAKEPPLAM